MRWTVKRIADALALDGWVRNNPDGTVRLVVEGDESGLDEFVSRLNDRMGMYIAEFRQKPVKPGKNRDGFDVMF